MQDFGLILFLSGSVIHTLGKCIKLSPSAWVGNAALLYQLHHNHTFLCMPSVAVTGRRI